MKTYALRLHEDRFAAGAVLAGPLPARNRVLYLVEGGLAVDATTLGPDEAWHGAGPVTAAAAAAGARVWRWELAPGDAPDAPAGGDGVDSRLLLDAGFELDTAAAYLIRCDNVEFPLGGVAFLHTHRGPGIRCLHHGEIRVETEGESRNLAPGEAWFESGPAPVYAAASEKDLTGFVRVMILPRALLGKSSIRYVRAEDKAKPKTQSYRVFVDAPIEI